MYTIEKVKTNDLDPIGLPIWEVIVRDYNGHAVHHDYCYTCDLDRMVEELQTSFRDIPDPWCVKMSSGGGTVYTYADCMTEQEARELVEYYHHEYVDENGFVWELYAERDEEAVEAREASKRTQRTVKV